MGLWAAVTCTHTAWGSLNFPTCWIWYIRSPPLMYSMTKYNRSWKTEMVTVEENGGSPQIAHPGRRGGALPWSGSRSAAAWGTAASPPEPAPSSQPWCTPRHHPGSPRPSSGFWWRTVRRCLSSQPASPERYRQESWLAGFDLRRLNLARLTLPKLPFPKTMIKLKSESLTRSWLPLLSYLHTEEEEEEESVGFPGPTLARWIEKKRGKFWQPTHKTSKIKSAVHLKLLSQLFIPVFSIWLNGDIEVFPFLLGQ